ncbi:hypothetical protein HBI33_003650 [Parastagonospora nodorum]|nr:hypothetical protein HBI33_003650 [Parastagonospora nodorum]
MSSFQIFEGASADQAFDVINMKKCKKTADITVNDTALDIICSTTTKANVLDQPWAFAILFGKPVEAGYDEPRAALEEHPLLHMTDIDDCVVVSMKYGGVEYSSLELVGSEDTAVQEPSSQPSNHASPFPTTGVPPRISTSKSSGHGSGIAPRAMDARSRLRLKYEKQLQEKNLALWLALQKRHKSIAARKPRGTYKTTQEDYWLDVFMQVFPDMPDVERAARLTVLEGLGDIDGNGWEAKWRSFASVQAYKPAEAVIDAGVWGPIFSHLSKEFEEFMHKPVADEQLAKPTPVYPSGPFTATGPAFGNKNPSALQDFVSPLTADQHVKPSRIYPLTPFTMTSPPFASQALSALKGFDKPKFGFLTNKESTTTLSSALSARTETSSPLTSVLQQPLPLFSVPSLFSNIGATTVSANRLDVGKTPNKTLPLGLQKPWKGLSVSAELKSDSPFVFDTSKLSGTIFSPQAAATTKPFVFGASSKAVVISETDHTTDHTTGYENEVDSSEVDNGISAAFLEDAVFGTYDIDSDDEFEDVWPVDNTEVEQLLSDDHGFALEETSIEELQLAPYTVGEYLTDNIYLIFGRPFECSREMALEKYAGLNAHYGVGLSSPCPPTWTRPSSILKWSEVVENFETDFVELTMPGASQSEKYNRVAFLMNELKVSMGEAWDTMDDVEPLPARVKFTTSQDGDKFEDDAMYAYVNGYDSLAQREYDASRSDTAITDEHYARYELASLPSSPIEVTIGQAGDKFEDDAIYGTADGYDLLAQRENDTPRTESVVTHEQFARTSPPPKQLEVTISQAGEKFEDDVMYGGASAYELLAQREYYSTDGEDESDGDDTSPPSSTDSPALSPERPLSPDDGAYTMDDLIDGQSHTTHHCLEAFELDCPEQTCTYRIAAPQLDASGDDQESQLPKVTESHPFGTPGPLAFDFDVNVETEVVAQGSSDVEHDTLVVFDEDSSASDNETIVTSDDEDFGYAKIATKAVPSSPSTHNLSDGHSVLNIEPSKDMRDWAETFCDQAFAAPLVPQLPVLQLETTAFLSLFDPNMLFETSDNPEDLDYVLPEFSTFFTPLSPTIRTDQPLLIPDLPIDKDKLISDLTALVAEIEHNHKPSAVPAFLVTPPEPERSAAYYRRINEAWAPTPRFTREDYKLRFSER